MFKGMKVISKVTMLAAMMTSSFSAQAATNWDLPLAWPADNYIVKSVDKFSQEVSVATKGELTITLHPGGSLGFKGPEMFYAVGDGLVMIGDMLLNQQSGSNPLLGLESLPYLIGSMEELQMFSAAYRPLLDEIYAKGNQKILFTIPWPQQQIFTRKKIETIEDMAGVKVRSYNKSSTEILEATGMTAVQLPWGEVVPSLAAGAIDAVATSSPSAVDGSFWEFLEYGYPTRQTWNTNVISVNLQAWKSLSTKNQQEIEALAKKLEPEFWAMAVTVDAEKMKTLAENGMINGDISDALRVKLAERAAPLREAALKDLGPKAQAVVESFMKQRSLNLAPVALAN